MLINHIINTLLELRTTDAVVLELHKGAKLYLTKYFNFSLWVLRIAVFSSIFILLYHKYQIPYSTTTSLKNCLKKMSYVGTDTV